MAINRGQPANVPSWRNELTPNIVDNLAKATPHALYAEYPRSTLSYEEGYRRITYGDLANAVNGVAWWLHESLGAGEESEALAYMGPNDLRYPALILGAAKAGYALFLTSPRNSVAAQMNLFNRLKCKIMLSPTPQPPPTTAVLKSYEMLPGQEMRVLEVPSVDDLLGKLYASFPFKKTFSEAFSDPFFIVHTSGSTGMPKPLVYKHSFGAMHTTMTSLEPPYGLESQASMFQGKRVFMTFPPFHAAFLATHLFNAIPLGTVVIAPTSGAIPSAEGLVDGLKKTPADVAFIVPSIVQELSVSPELLEYCAKNLEMIIYCGGDLPQSIGDVVASKVKLLNQYGASEIGLTHLLQSKSNRGPEDWKYVQFHPGLGAEFRQITDGQHELCIARDSKLKEQQPTFALFPDLQEYPSRDIFVQHPSKDKPDLWKWVARADDIIVFLNGEKTNPISMEQHIASCGPGVAAALVAGAQRFQAALLVEPVSDRTVLSPSERAAFIEEIWPTIEEANQDCPAHARILKSHILLTHPQKPMLRAGKGTIQRAGTVQLYAKELDALYADAEVMTTEVRGEHQRPLDRLDDVEAVSRIIQEILLSITSWQRLDEADNIFTLGMDSLQALVAVRKLKQALAMPSIAVTTIYTNPSVSALSNAIIRLSKQHQDSQTFSEQALYQERGEMINTYKDMIDQMPRPQRSSKLAHGDTVILTGSTGALGSYILHTLLANKAVAHVYCLNRAADGLSLQIERSQARGLNTELDSTRVTFLAADLAQPSLGLEPGTYKELLDAATLVIHNAWPVNFNLSLSSFNPQLVGLVNLIKFTAEAASSPRLLFISSISSVMSYRSSSMRTPEEVIFDDSAPGPNGYAMSKNISELLLDYAAQKLSMSTSFARVGQIAGAVQYAGLWNKAEWFPSLVISSLHIGAIPDSLGPSLSNIDWVPVDVLAEILVELGLDNNQQPEEHVSHNNSTLTGMSRGGARVFHPLNPQPTTWKVLRPVVIQELHSITGKQLETISMDAWLKRIRKDMETSADSSQALKGSNDVLRDEELETFLQANPAVKLLDFYEGVLDGEREAGNRLEIEETKKRSAKLRAVEGVKPEWVRKWVREWFEGVQG